MPKRSEVDIRVTQELKNHQDFIYETNQAIQNLNVKLVNLSLECEKSKAKAQSENKALEIAFEKFTDKILVQMKQFEERISGFEKAVKKYTEQHVEEICDLENFKADYSEFIAFANKVEKRFKDVDEITDKNNMYQADWNRLLIGKIHEEARKLENKIMPKMPDLTPMMQKVDEKLDIMRVDFAGIFKEIDYLKKDVDVIRKKLGEDVKLRTETTE